MPDPVEISTARKRGINWSALAPGIAFILIIGVAIGWYLQQEALAQREAEELSKQAAALGVPSDFPLNDVPIYPGLKVTEKKHEDAKSTDGRPMDLWEVHGTTPDDKKLIFDYYKDKMLGRGMGQTQYISIPTGFGVTYADEVYSVEFEIEKQPKDKETRVVIRAYRLRK